MSAITSHVLDLARGRPAEGVSVALELHAGGEWRLLARGVTDADGRLRDLLAAAQPAAGTYRLTFDTASYFARHGIEGFYPEVTLVFLVREAGERHHVPLLLSPYGYSTYRGS